MLHAIAVGAQPNHPSATEITALGFDPERLGRIDTVINEHVRRGELAGAVVYVSRAGRTAHFRAYGLQDIEAGRAMSTDAIFRVASFTKPVIAVAVMMLYEEGRFRLHDPVAKFIPAFEHARVAVPPNPQNPAVPGKSYAIEAVKRPIQIRDLLTHLAGLSYGEGLASADYRSAQANDWNLATKDETIGEFVNRLAKLPLHSQPGEKFIYGFSYDVLGHLVEILSGIPLDRFLEERIFRPLGMTDTCFFLATEKSPRLAKLYGIENGKLVLNETADHSPQIRGPRKCFSGGSGLVSTARDFGRFLEMLVNDGTLDGTRILSPKSVDLMRANHTGDKAINTDWGYRNFGFGFWILDDLGFHGELGSAGSYGWGSTYYPQWIVDPRERIVAILLTQLRPAGDLDLNRRWRVPLYQALSK
jgi:CubicO group peptidase (beta-lactamase class C family)